MNAAASRALVVQRPGSFRFVEREQIPPGHGEVVIDVHAAGVCGSDYDLWRGTRPDGLVRFPVVPGHEWSGTVAATGPGTDPNLRGRKVVGEGFRNCQVCRRCRAGQTTLCEAAYDETGFTSPGAMADTLTIPARLLHVLPDDADLTAAALLEPASCAAVAAHAAGIEPGDRVAVIGAGTLGALTTQLVAARTPADLLVVGIHDRHRTRARDCGAHRYLSAGTLSGEGDFDVVIEAAGAPDSAATALSLTRRGGRVVLTGIPAAGAVGLSPTDLVVSNTEVRTVFGATSAAWVQAVRAFEAGILRPHSVITHRLPLTEFATAMTLLGEHDPTVGKILLHPHP